MKMEKNKEVETPPPHPPVISIQHFKQQIKGKNINEHFPMLCFYEPPPPLTNHRQGSFRDPFRIVLGFQDPSITV